MSQINIKQDTKFSEIANKYAKLDDGLAGKHLRLGTDGVMHLHDSGKWSGWGEKAAAGRAAKHSAAFEAVKTSIDKQLGVGMGDRILRNVLDPQKFQDKLISVADLQQINADVKATTREDRITSILDVVGPRIGNDHVLQELGDLIRNNPSVDIPLLKTQVDVVRNSGPLQLDMVQLKQDLQRGDMGFCQVLAKHGVIDTDRTPSKMGINKHHWAKTPDVDAFKYSRLVSCQKVIGTNFQSEGIGGFVVCRTNGAFEGQTTQTGDKVHLSVDPSKVSQAWELVVPILMRNSDLVPEFKVSDMAHLYGSIDKHTQAQQKPGASPKQISDSQVTIDDAVRVTEGAQLTLYFHGDPTDTSSAARMKVMLAEIATTLDQAGIDPGKPPTSDHKVNDYSTYRFEKKDNGQRLETNDPEYDRYKAAMLQRPFFQGIV